MMIRPWSVRAATGGFVPGLAPGFADIVVLPRVLD